MYLALFFVLISEIIWGDLTWRPPRANSSTFSSLGLELLLFGKYLLMNFLSFFWNDWPEYILSCDSVLSALSLLVEGFSVLSVFIVCNFFLASIDLLWAYSWTAWTEFFFCFMWRPGAVTTRLELLLSTLSDARLSISWSFFFSLEPKLKTFFPWCFSAEAKFEIFRVPVLFTWI